MKNITFYGMQFLFDDGKKRMGGNRAWTGRLGGLLFCVRNIIILFNTAKLIL